VQADSIVDALERFFLDIVGTAIPGGAALLAIPALFGGSIAIGPVYLTPGGPNFSWILFILVAYAAGHAVNSFGETILTRLLELVVPPLGGVLKKVRMGWLAPKFVQRESELFRGISESPPYNALLEEVKRRYNWSPAPDDDIIRQVRDLRDIAMTIARDDLPTVYRFRFLSLLALGLASVVLFAVAVALVARLARIQGIPATEGELNVWLLVGLLVLSGFFLERRYMFYRTSIRVPFSMAMAELILAGAARADKKSSPAGAGSKERLP
jgi:hypothetical protein